MQAHAIKAIKQIARETSLQVIEEACNPRMKAIGWVIEDLRLFINDMNKATNQRQVVNREEVFQGVNCKEQDYNKKKRYFKETIMK